MDCDKCKHEFEKKDDWIDRVVTTFKSCYLNYPFKDALRRAIEIHLPDGIDGTVCNYDELRDEMCIATGDMSLSIGDKVKIRRSND